MSVPGYPTLRASIAYERPRRFRLRAETGLTGPEVDLGSNDQVFWFWVRRSQPPAVYFCRHEQYLTGRARQIIPVDPSWVIEALGVAELDPGLPHQGPFPAKGNRLEVRTIRETPEGPTTKVTIIDALTAWVMEQRILRRPGPAAGQLRGGRLPPRSAERLVHPHGDPPGLPAGPVLDADRPGQRPDQQSAQPIWRTVDGSQLSRHPAGRSG